MQMFSREEVDATYAETRNNYDNYIMERRGRLRIELEKFDKYKNQTKRDECWAKVELETRLLRNWLPNFKLPSAG